MIVIICWMGGEAHGFIVNNYTTHAMMQDTTTYSTSLQNQPHGFIVINTTHASDARYYHLPYTS